MLSSSCSQYHRPVDLFGPTLEAQVIHCQKSDGVLSSSQFVRLGLYQTEHRSSAWQSVVFDLDITVGLLGTAE